MDFKQILAVIIPGIIAIVIGRQILFNIYPDPSDITVLAFVIFGLIVSAIAWASGAVFNRISRRK